MYLDCCNILTELSALYRRFCTTKILIRNTSRNVFAIYRELACPGTGIFVDTEIIMKNRKIEFAFGKPLVFDSAGFDKSSGFERHYCVFRQPVFKI